MARNGKPATDAEKAQKRADYAWYKEHGICVRCHQQDAFEGHTLCADCLYKTSLRVRTHTDEQKARYAANRKAKRHAWVEQGLCSVCGKPVTPGYKVCAYHLAVKRKQQRKDRSKTVKGYYQQGLCRICGAEPVPGKSYCAVHLADKQREAAQAREHINREAMRRKAYQRKEQKDEHE